MLIYRIDNEQAKQLTAVEKVTCLLPQQSLPRNKLHHKIAPSQLMLHMSKAFDTVNRTTLHNDLRPILENNELHINNLMIRSYI